MQKNSLRHAGKAEITARIGAGRPHGDGFPLVVERMAGNDDIGPKPLGRPDQQSVTRLARRSREAGRRLLALPAHAPVGNGEIRTELRNRISFDTGFRPQAVIDGRRHQTMAAAAARLQRQMQRQQQARRIASARNRDQNRCRA